MSTQSLIERFLHLQQAIQPRATLIVASKTQPAASLTPLLNLGHRAFGENRVQEAAQKWPPLLAVYPDTELHLIGALQTNKVKEALALFHVIQTLDREKLAAAIAKQAQGARTRAYYVQVNTGEEPQKAGINPKQTLDFVRYCQHDLGLPVTGLMAIPPADVPPSPHFALLKKLADMAGLSQVSMGMSDDWRLALDLGATHCRLGSAIFGARPVLPSPAASLPAAH